MYRIAVCDNKQAQAEELKKLILELAAELGLECSVDVFKSFKRL